MLPLPLLTRVHCRLTITPRTRLQKNEHGGKMRWGIHLWMVDGGVEKFKLNCEETQNLFLGHLLLLLRPEIFVAVSWAAVHALPRSVFCSVFALCHCIVVSVAVTAESIFSTWANNVEPKALRATIISSAPKLRMMLCNYFYYYYSFYPSILLLLIAMSRLISRQSVSRPSRFKGVPEEHRRRKAVVFVPVQGQELISPISPPVNWNDDL